jgi:hypothetical protein
MDIILQEYSGSYNDIHSYRRPRDGIKIQTWYDQYYREHIRVLALLTTVLLEVRPLFVCPKHGRRKSPVVFI